MFIITRTKGYKPEEVKATSHQAAADKWMQDEMYVWDADFCGSDTEYFAVSDGSVTKYYKAKVEWWIDYNPEWEIHNVFELVEITRDEAKTHEVVDHRDWMFV